MIVRHLRPNEGWPVNVPIGFECPQLDRDWCWVAEDSQGIQGGLMACPMHGAIFLLRLVAANGAPTATIRVLLNKVLHEVRSAGYFGFITMIDPGTEAGRKLAHIAEGIGGVHMPDTINLVYGSLAEL